MAKKQAEEKKEVKKQLKALKKDYISTVGRRKEAVARVRLYPKGLPAGRQGSGAITVNAKPIEEYFRGEASKVAYMQPLALTDTVNAVDITVKVEGGGQFGQLDAVVHGIARALEKYDKDKFRPTLKKAGLLTRDARTRERRKVGMGGKARRKKQSPKR